MEEQIKFLEKTKNDEKEMNDFTVVFWILFPVAFAFTHFNIRIVGICSQESLRSKATARGGREAFAVAPDFGCVES